MGSQRALTQSQRSMFVSGAEELPPKMKYNERTNKKGPAY
jgi:hypothetical protein